MRVRTNKMFDFIPPEPGHIVSYRDISPRYIDWYKFNKLMKRCFQAKLTDGEYVMYDDRNVGVLMDRSGCKLYKDI